MEEDKVSVSSDSSMENEPTRQTVDSDDDQAVDPNATEVTLAKGKIKKKVLRKGHGDTPSGQADVEVHYVGRLLDGTKFDSSRDRGELFKFKLGQGQVIKGWDRGVATMRRGELAEFTIDPEYAYGAAGSPPKIPPNATLVFEIELVDWSSKEKLVSDGSVLKEVVEAGRGSVPNEGAVMQVKLVAHLGSLEGHAFDAVNRDEPRHIVLGEDLSVPEGLYIALKSMRKGERARVTVLPKHAYGAKGNAALGVPPDTVVVYEADVVDVVNAKESWEMSLPEKIETMKRRKAVGNGLFGQERWHEAFDRYESAMRLVRYESKFDESQKNEAETLKEQVLANMAACKLKLQDWKDAIKHATEALSIDPKNVKVLFRRAQAHAHLEDHELAMIDIRAALSIDPNNEAVKKLFTSVSARVKAAREKERRLFGNMFNKIKLVDEEGARPPASPGRDSDTAASHVDTDSAAPMSTAAEPTPMSD